MRTKLAIVAVGAMLLVTVPGVARAGVATSCTFDAGTATVTAVIGTGGGPTLVRNGDAIEFGGVPCGAATVTTTDTIDISDGDPNTGESLTISLAGGRLVPGKTPEDDGTDEIEMVVDSSYQGGLTLIGSDVADNFYARAAEIDLNANVSGDPEIVLPITTTTTVIDGGKGNDVLHTRMYQAIVSGGEGDDVIEPVDYGPSSYDGGPGNDVLSYAFQGLSLSSSTGDIHALGGGAATIVRAYNVSDSAQGFETFEAFDGPTRFYGSADADHFIGGPYNDWFLPLGGDDVIDGGPATGIGTTRDYDTLTTGASASGVTFDMDAQKVAGEGNDSYRDIEILQGSPQRDVFAGDPSEDGILEIDGYGGHDLLDLRGANNPQWVYLGPDTPPGWLWAIGMAKVIGSQYADHLAFTSGDAPADFHGREGNDVLIGGPLADVLRGGADDDTIRGKAGPDTIDGNSGTDRCFGGPGKDAITGCEGH